MQNKKPIALITGASRKNGIGAAVAIELSKKGWDIAITYWTDYDRSMPWGSNKDDLATIEQEVRSNGCEFMSFEADLSQTEIPGYIFNLIETKMGPVSALILSHCYSVDSDILSTSIDQFNLHFDINTRASWLLIKEFAKRFVYSSRPGRIIGLTSDHTAFNLPYGASKGALDRIVLAGAEELKDKRILSNVINPGANDTGWMDRALMKIVKDKSFQKRIGTPSDTAHLISFLCSREGEWINGQLLYSNGGIRW